MNEEETAEFSYGADPAQVMGLPGLDVREGREFSARSVHEFHWRELPAGTRYCVPVFLLPEEDGVIPVYVPNLPGAVSEGESEHEALENIEMNTSR